MSPERPIVPINPVEGVRVEGRIDSIGSLVSELQTYLDQRGTGLHLVHSILTVDQIKEFVRKLSLRETAQRFKKFENRPEIDNPLLQIVAGQFVSLDILEKGPEPKNDALRLFQILKELGVETREGVERISPAETSRSLGETLTIAMKEASFPEELSIPDQLEDLLCSSGLGLLIKPRRQLTEREDQTLALPQLLLEILGSLKTPESAGEFKDWIISNIGPNTPESINLLRTLTRFTFLLDHEAYVQLYSGGRGKIPLLPFQSLYNAISWAKTDLERHGGYERVCLALEEIEKEVILRFNQVFRGPLVGTSSIDVETTTVLAPSEEDLALTFITCAEDCQKNHGLSYKQAAYYGIKLLEQLQIADPKTFCQYVEDLDPKLGKALLREAKRFGIVPDQENTILKETFHALEANPWRDLLDYDFTRIIRPETETVEFYTFPGTVGPFHKGHEESIERLDLFLDFLESLDSLEAHIQRFIVILPITNTVGLTGYDKEPAAVGPIYARVGSIILQLTEADREKVFISTKLGPDPRQAGDIVKSLNAAHNALSTKLTSDFSRAGKVAGVDMKLLFCGGLDECIWSKERNIWTLAPQQPKKLQRDSVLLGRHGYQVSAMLSGERFAENTNVLWLILASGSPGASSTIIRQKLRDNGDLSDILVPAHWFVQKYWGPEAITRRRKGGFQEQEIPSVTAICEELLREYKKEILDLAKAA